MFRQTILSIIFGLISFITVWGAEADKPIPASLDEAKTFEEIQSYVEHVFTESRKNLKTLEDNDRFLEIYPPIGIAGGRKIIALGGDDESLDYGYGTLLAALHWSCRKNPENIKKIESLLEEIKKTGKFSNIIVSGRFMLFFNQSRLLEKEIPVKPFNEVKAQYDALVKAAKELIAIKQDDTSYAVEGPMQVVLDMAGGISIAQNSPQFLEDATEDLVRYVTSERIEEKQRKKYESHVRSYRRQMVGSPFELWGKTVEGSEFNWNDYKGKIVLIDFTASWCGPCRVEMPNIVEMYEKYHGKGLEVVSIGVSDKTENLKKMIEEDKITFTMISEELSEGDSRGLPSDYYAVIVIPQILLIGKDGRIVATNLRGPTLRDSVEKQFASE